MSFSTLVLVSLLNDSFQSVQQLVFLRRISELAASLPEKLGLVKRPVCSTLFLFVSVSLPSAEKIDISISKFDLISSLVLDRRFRQDRVSFEKIVLWTFVLSFESRTVKRPMSSRIFLFISFIVFLRNKNDKTQNFIDDPFCLLNVFPKLKSKK